MAQSWPWGSLKAIFKKKKKGWSQEGEDHAIKLKGDAICSGYLIFLYLTNFIYASNNSQQSKTRGRDCLYHMSC